MPTRARRQSSRLARANLQAEAAQIEQMLAAQPNYRVMYNERLAYDAALRQYVVDIAEFEKWLAKHRAAQCRATEIEPQLTCLPALQAELLAAATYEQALSHFQRAMIEYAGRMSEVEV